MQRSLQFQSLNLGITKVLTNHFTNPCGSSFLTKASFQKVASAQHFTPGHQPL